MKPHEAQTRFKKLIIDSGKLLPAFSAADAISFMLTFYREVRAVDCPLDEDGDSLLFQWGAYGEDGSFSYDITRQFILAGSESDDGMSQLSLTVYFPLTDALRALKGNRWCWSPAEVDEFEKFIHTHPATHAVLSIKPIKVTLNWNAF